MKFKVIFFFLLFFLVSSKNLWAVESGNSVTDRLYTGQIKDDTGLYYYNARYYDPQLGIFTSADRAQGPNRYAYVGGNPIMRNDPSGNEGSKAEFIKSPHDLLKKLVSRRAAYWVEKGSDERFIEGITVNIENLMSSIYLRSREVANFAGYTNMDISNIDFYTSKASGEKTSWQSLYTAAFEPVGSLYSVGQRQNSRNFSQFFGMSELSGARGTKVSDLNIAVLTAISLTEGNFGDDDPYNAHVGRDFLMVLGQFNETSKVDVWSSPATVALTLRSYWGYQHTGEFNAVKDGHLNKDLFKYWHSSPSWYGNADFMYQQLTSFAKETDNNWILRDLTQPSEKWEGYWSTKGARGRYIEEK